MKTESLCFSEDISMQHKMSGKYYYNIYRYIAHIVTHMCI